MTSTPRAPSRLAGLVGLGAAVLAVLAPGTASAFDYVALGDSYSSGTGTREYYEDCERSFNAYSHRIDPQIPGNLKLIACGGAKTNAIAGQANQLSADTEYVTISVGGNDAGFSDVLLECAQPEWLSDCDPKIDAAQATINNTLPGLLNGVYSNIRSKAPNAAVTVVGYPRLFNGEDCNAATFFEGGEMTRLNQTADLLAEMTRARAQAHGFGFADPRGAYLGHAVCDDDEWLNGLSNPTGESFHPNVRGHDIGYAGIVRAALLAQPAPADARGPNGRIAFTRGAAGSEDVFVINSNGPPFPTNLTADNGGTDTDPAFSPDGTKIAFASVRNGETDLEIYVLSLASGALTKLTNNTADDREPTWSPNGQAIAFRSARDGNNEIYKMTASGGSQTRLTANADSEFAPAWSPDGAEIAYQRFGSQNDIWKMSSDGQGQTRLTTDGANDGAPEYSPNGTQIAFHSNRGGSDFEIFTMSATGGSQTARTSNSANDERPAWSPSGGSIAFSSDRDGDHEIYTMTSTGGSQTRRTTLSGTDIAPSWQGDKTPPATTLAAEPQGTINTSTPTFTFSADEPGSTFECKVDSGAFTGCSSPSQTQVLSEGSHTFQVRAIDPSGNVDGSPAQRSVTIEAPIQTAITSGPSGPINTPTATFSFDAANPSTVFVCLVDDVPVSVPCSSEFTTAALPDGPHSFTVRGTDGVNTSEDSSEFVVDTVAPDTSLASGPGAVTNQVRPSFELAAQEGSSFECRIDSAPFASCVSPFEPGEDLPDGAHTFEARATDPAGNAEVDPLVVAFEVDTAAPDAAIDDGPPEATDPPAAPTATSNNQHPFSFSSGDGTASFECRLDSLDEADWVACDSPFAPPAPLADGNHVFEVRSVDPASNAGDAASRRFVVDATAPETTITGGPAQGASVKDATFVFEADDPDASYECRLDSSDDGDWEPCEPGMKLVVPGSQTEADPDGQPLSEGPHEFEVRAFDQLGNRDGTAEARGFTIDRTAPSTTLAGEPAGPINDPTPTFSFAGAGGAASFECKIDAAAFAVCMSPLTLPPQPDGAHTFSVRALDAAGNADDPVVRDFRVDTAEPVVTIGGRSLTNDATPTFDLSADEPVSFTCKVDEAPVACGASVTSPTLTQQGPHTLSVRATDAAGNVTDASKPFEFDSLPPQTTLVSGPTGSVGDPTPTFAFSGGAGDDLECRVDAAAFAPCSSPWTTPVLADGSHTAESRAVDEAGNADPTPVRWAIIVDTSAPQVTIDTGPREVTREAAPAFTFSAPGASRFECALDGGDFAPCTSPHSTGALGYGDHTFAVRAYDAAGNRGDATVRSFTITTASNDFSIAKPKKNTKRGTADLFVTVPDPGRLELGGKGVKRVTKAVSKPGTTKLRITATGSAARRLEDEGALKLVARVTFTPDGGDAKTKSKRIKLVRR